MTPNVENPAIDVVIADDYEPVRSLLSRLLSRQRDLHIVGVASTGEEAIKLARERRPDVVIMDVDMPGMGGIEATRRLVQVLPGVRVIGHSANEVSSVMREAGAVGFVRKGEALDDLLRAIRAN